MASESSGGGVGVMSLLGLVFVGLKLAKVIDWSWWWVTLPFWGGIALFFVVLLVGLLVLALKEIL